MKLPVNINLSALGARTRMAWRFGLLATLLTALALPPLVAADEERGAPSQLTAEKLDGTRYSLGDSRGSIAVLAVWSPDSLGSRKSIGELQRFATQYQPRGVSVIAVSTSGDADRLRRFAAERQLDVPMAMMLANDFGPLPEQSLPQIYVFDRSGRYRAIHRGLFRLRTLEQMISPLLDE